MGAARAGVWTGQIPSRGPGRRPQPLRAAVVTTLRIRGQPRTSAGFRPAGRGRGGSGRAGSAKGLDHACRPGSGVRDPEDRNRRDGCLTRAYTVLPHPGACRASVSPGIWPGQSRSTPGGFRRGACWCVRARSALSPARRGRVGEGVHPHSSRQRTPSRPPPQAGEEKEESRAPSPFDPPLEGGSKASSLSGRG